MNPTFASDHGRWADSTAAYLLGALNEDEVTPFQEHLRECAICRQEVEDLRVAADALPASAMPVTPPPELKGRIMAIVESEARLLSAAGERADRPERPPEEEPRRREGWLSRLFNRPALAAGLAALLLVIGGAGGVLIGRSGDDEPAAPQIRTLQANFTPGAAPGASAQLRIGAEGAELVGTNLPDPPRGRVYQVWLLRPGRTAPEPTTSLFGVRSGGTTTAAVPGNLDNVAQVLVSAEPPGGSEAPTSTPILSVPVQS